MNLFIDAGNSFIKFSSLSGSEIKTFRYNTKEKYSVDSLYSLLDNSLKTTYDNIYFSSVVPSVDNLIENLTAKYFGQSPRKIAHPMKTGVNIKLKSRTSEIGSDLICLAAFASGDKPTIIINLGTATTIMYVLNKSIEGVIISPGIEIKLKSLIDNASKLFEINLEQNKILDKVLGKDTEEALSIGILKGHTKMLEGLVEDIDPNARVIISGGNSHRIKFLFPPTWEHIDEATTRGMIKIAELNNKI